MGRGIGIAAPVTGLLRWPRSLSLERCFHECYMEAIRLLNAGEQRFETVVEAWLTS
jgi:hypothetical protein